MVLVPSATKNRRQSFYDGDTYNPNTLNGWVATRDLPWNTIGTALENAHSGDGQQVDHLMTAQEALTIANLDFEVKKVQTTDPETGQPIPKLFATYMDDESEKVGRYYFAGVSDMYEPVKPARALSIFDEIVMKHEGAHYSAVWAMKEKSQMGVTIEFPESIIVDPKGAADEIGLFGLGWNSFDTSTGLGFGASAIRWFCMNQYNPGLKGVQRGFSMKHTKNVGSKAAISKAQDAIGIVMDWGKALDEIANEMYAIKVTDSDFIGVLRNLKPFRIDEDDSETVKVRKKERIELTMAAWRAPHNENITNTRWGAYNVVTEWADWGRTVNGSYRTGADSTRQRAIGILVNPTVSGVKKAAWEILTADLS